MRKLTYVSFAENIRFRAVQAPPLVPSLKRGRASKTVRSQAGSLPNNPFGVEKEFERVVTNP